MELKYTIPPRITVSDSGAVIPIVSNSASTDDSLEAPLTGDDALRAQVLNMSPIERTTLVNEIRQHVLDQAAKKRDDPPPIDKLRLAYKIARMQFIPIPPKETAVDSTTGEAKVKAPKTKSEKAAIQDAANALLAGLLGED